jgi:uncharacterized membrane protein YfcA
MFIPEGVSNVPLFLALGAVAAALFSMAKAGFGGSVALLSTPLMIYAAGDSKLALGIMLPMLIAADYAAAISWLRQWDLRQAMRLLPGMLVGVAAAWGLMAYLKSVEAASSQRVSDGAMRLAVGVVALAFVGLQVLRWLRKDSLAFRPSGWHSAGFGTLAGATSTLAHAAGPVVAMYLLPQQMPKGRYVATTAIVFWVLNQVKLVPYACLGMVNSQTLGAGLILLPAVVAGAVLGVLLHRRLGNRQFTGIIYVLLALTGAQLIFEGVQKLTG